VPLVDSNKYCQLVMLVALDKYAARPKLENFLTSHFAGRVSDNLRRSVF